MNYNDDIKRSITYIEMHIKEELTVNEIAEHVGYSVFHFCRVFSLYQGTPLMDYVRKKRLIQAKEELLSNRKIIDIAFDYGFKTASGFSKNIHSPDKSVLCTFFILFLFKGICLLLKIKEE